VYNTSIENMEKLKHLHGMRDISHRSWETSKTAQDRLREFFSSYGYRTIETPVLEPTELFLRKSGGELAARMYTFTDPGGNQVSLRPEYTASIVRHYVGAGFSASLYGDGEGNSPVSPITKKRSGEAGPDAPVRVQYAGPVFRYEEGSSYRQFTQVGAELLGALDPRADAEVLSLSCLGLSSLGIKGHRLEMGDLGVLYVLLESLGLSERAIVFILSSIGDLRRGPEGLARVRERAHQLRLLASNTGQGYLQEAEHLSVVIREMEENKARELLHGMLQWSGLGPLGQRDPSEVVERLMRKFRGTDDSAGLEQGIEIAYRMASVRGAPEESLAEVERLIKAWELDPSVLDNLRRMIELLDRDQMDGVPVILDFGLARGLAYYTGIVFEIKHPAIETSLGGGGRYDGLAKALGSPSNVPALGFAYTLEHLVDALCWLKDEGDGEEEIPGPSLMVVSKGGAYKDALRLAQSLRAKGKMVEMDVCSMDLEEGLSYARARGIAEVIAVDDDGKSTTYQVGNPS
jgi:histidyl-tRNA synthetase